MGASKHQKRSPGPISAGPALRFALTALLLASPAGAEHHAVESWLPTGVYRLEVRLASTAELPHIGATEMVTVSVSRVEIERVRGAWIQHHRVCRIWDASPGGWGRVRYPKAFVSALAPARIRFALVRMPSGRIRYVADLGREWLGMAAGARLPQEPDAAAVRDSDRDGLPGVTIHLGLRGLPDAELQVAQRTHTVLRGWLDAPGRLTGQVDVREFAQSVLAASPSFLRHETRIRHDPARSSFELVRADEREACATSPGEETAYNAAAGR
jgi:hypothetical protein